MKMHEMKNGTLTNDKYAAEASYTEATNEERAIAIFRLQIQLKKMLKVISAKTLAEGWGISAREVVRMARWDDSKKYRQPRHALVIELLESL